MAIKRIAVLTGGGDVPGLNAVIKSVVYGATGMGDFDVIGLRRGWEALSHMNLEKGWDDAYVRRLDRDNTRTIDRTGGTFLHTSRTKPSKIRPEKLPEHAQAKLGMCKKVGNDGDERYDVTPIVIENLQRLGVDYLLPIGGDDTLSYAAELHSQGFPVIAVPKTMDNDVQNTEYCIGFSTALTRAVDAISRQRTTVGSHERIGIFRIFGRDAGFTALYTAYVTNIRCCIPEVVFDLDKLINMLVEDKRNNPSRYSLVVLSEGATWEGRKVQEYGEPDAYGHRKRMNVGEAFSEEVKRRANEETIASDLTYDLRGGDPDFVDKMVATTFATMAVECIASGVKGRMTGIRNGCFVDTELPDPALGPRKVDLESMYNIDRYRPNYQNKSGRPIFLTRA